MRISCLRFITGFVLATGVAATAAQQQTAPPRDAAQAAKVGTAIIKGRVLLEGGGAAREATVNLAAVEGGPNRSTRTDGEGRFTFTAVVAGKYRLNAGPAPGAARHLPQGYRDPNAPVPAVIDVADGATIDNINVRLPRASAFGGRVFDEFGEPLAYARITVTERLTGGRERGIDTYEVRTDDHGRYRVFALRPGDYVVKAEPQRGNVDPSKPVPLATYYPATLNPAEAAVVKIGPGQELADVDITITRGETYTVRGVVLDSTGQPAAGGVNVSVRRAMTVGATAWQGGNVQPDGTFIIRNVTGGEYTLRAVSRAQQGRTAAFATLPVSVHDNVENVIVTLQPGASLRGTVSFEGEAPTAITGMRVSVAAADEIGTGVTANAQVRPDGTFVVPNLFGPTIIGASGPRGWYLKSVIVDGRDIIGQPLDLRGGDKQVQLVLTQTPASLTGIVTDQRGAPVEAGVIVFAEDKGLWSARSITTRTGSANAEGKFTIVPLLPGRYLAVALPRDEASTGGARESFFELLVPHATSFTIGEAEKQTLNLKLVSLRPR